MESMKNMDKKTTGNKNINDEHDITEKVESSDYSSMRNALDEDDNITSKNTENIPSDSSNDYYYKDYCQKSPILYNNKKTNVFDTKNSNLLRMSNRPHSVAKNLKQNRISVNPNCLPEIKIRPESLMLEEEFAKEVSRIFKYYDESLRYSKNSIQSFDSNKTHRINKSQTKESFSSSKRNSRNLQLNRLSKNIKRKKGASALKKRISQNRSLVILPIEPGITPNRKSSLSDYRVSFIQKGTYMHSKSEYYFDHSIGSPESEISSEISPLNSSCSAGSPASIGLTTPTEGNISIDISNMNVKSKNRMSNNAVKTKSNIYQIQQMPYKIQYNDDEANKYESVNITIENTNDSLVDEDSVVLQVNEDDEIENKSGISKLNNDENFNLDNNENQNDNIIENKIDEIKNDNNKNKLTIIIDNNNSKNNMKKDVSSTESVTYDICESMFNENDEKNDDDKKCLMSPVCESDLRNNDIEVIDNLHLCGKSNSNRKSEQFSVNIVCKEDEDNNEKNSNYSSYCDISNDDKTVEKLSNKRNTFGYLDINSENAIKTINENINKRMTLSNQRDTQDINSL